MSAGTRIPFSVEHAFVVADSFLCDGEQLEVGASFDWTTKSISPYDLATLWTYGKIDCVGPAPIVEQAPESKADEPAATTTKSKRK